MKKAFIILTGDIEARDLLQEMMKKNYWIWNVSPLRHLRNTATALEWNFSEEVESVAFIERLMEMSNEFLDFEYKHIVKFMRKTMESTKAEENGKIADVLMVEVGKDLADRLQDEFRFFVLNVHMGKLVEDNFENGCLTLGLGGINTEEEVYKAIQDVMNIIIG